MCEDVDECAEVSGLCAPGQCLNTEPGYQCRWAGIGGGGSRDLNTRLSLVQVPAPVRPRPGRRRLCRHEEGAVLHERDGGREVKYF